MEQNPLVHKTPEPKKSSQEQLVIDVEIAGPEDWEAYRDLRLEAISGDDSEMFGEGVKARDRAKTDLDWQKDVAPDNKNMFVVLAWHGDEAIGMGIAERREKEEGAWRMTSGYVKKKFRGEGVGKKMFAFRLEDIIRQGGKKVTLGIRAKNAPSLRIPESLGGKIRRTWATELQKISKIGWHNVEIDLTDPKVVREIADTLDADLLENER